MLWMNLIPIMELIENCPLNEGKDRPKTVSPPAAIRRLGLAERAVIFLQSRAQRDVCHVN